MRAVAMSLMLVCAPAAADVAGYFENDAGGKTYLSSEQGRCPPNMRMIVSTGQDEQTILMTGCYGMHNGVSVVVLWQRGMAVVVPVSSVTWIERPAAEPPKKSS